MFQYPFQQAIFHYSIHDRMPACSTHFSLLEREKNCPHCLLEVALYYLTTHPGNIDDYMRPVTEALYTTPITENTLAEVAETIFEKVSVTLFNGIWSHIVSKNIV